MTKEDTFYNFILNNVHYLLVHSVYWYIGLLEVS